MTLAQQSDDWRELYDPLRRIAVSYLRAERSGHTLQATALVHEAWVRLERDHDELDRAEYLRSAARVMRQILVEYARARNAKKRGGRWNRITLQDVTGVAAAWSPDVLELDELLDRLAHHRPDAAHLIELRIFAGCTMEEAASALGLSSKQARLDWKFARAWLLRELERGER